MTTTTPDTLPWYKDGLRFACTGCGGCCTGAPGYVWMTETEMQSLATHLQLPINDFKQKYTRYVSGRYSLKEKPASYDCIFLDGKACTVYDKRPSQCRTFPWWKENLKSPAHWEEARRDCEGINDSAPLVPLEEILRQLKSKGI